MTTAWQATPQMQRFFYVYILVSEADTTTHYTGVTQDLKERLREHNRGACPHSSKCRPWRLETAIAFKSEIKAHAFERYLKSGSGREFARRHF
jgi:predicted GIY-YIG superfamily endonuclease